MKSPAIGIDLGTTYSCVAVWENGRAEIISNDQGNRTTPSIVAFNRIERLIGEGAKNQISVNPENTILNVKRLIGKKFEDPQVANEMKFWPFKVINVSGNPNIEVEYRGEKKQFNPQEISSMILAKMRQTAEVYLGKTVTEAVVTVPAYFNDLQRQATKDAANIAGLNVLKIINEPTAAGLAYGLNKKSPNLRNVLIYDLGGGTFDVSLLEIKNQVFNVKATSGDSHLGGEDFNNRLVNYFVTEFKKKHKIDLTSSTKAIVRLRFACEGAKRTLSSHVNVSINIDSIYEGIDFYSSISRAKFEDLCLDLFNSTLKPIDKVLKASKMSKSSINEIILVGGSTRIPKIQSLVAKYFDGKEPSKTINPDEAVANGASIQAAMLTTRPSDIIKDIILTDITPLSLGIHTLGGFMANIIPSNTQIPCKEMRVFYTSEDYQTSVPIQVFQGERPMTEDNLFIDKFNLNGLPSLLKGQAKVKVTFEINHNGILQVSAKDTVNNSTQSITISPNNYRLTTNEITKLTKEAKQYKTEDKTRVNQIKARYKFEAYLYCVKGIMNHSKTKKQLPHKKINQVQKVIDRAVDWLADNQNASVGRYTGYLHDVELSSKHLVQAYLKLTGRKNLCF